MTWMRFKNACEGPGQYGLNVAASDYVAQGVRLVRTTDLASGHLSPDEDGIFIPEPVSPSARLSEGDVLLSRSGTIGRAFLVPSEASGMAFAGFLVRFRHRKDVDPRYLYYATQSQSFQEQVRADAITSTIQNFNAERYANISVWCPPLPVQRQVADFLDRQVAQRDSIKTLRMEQVELLRQRLQAAVDGHFDIPEGGTTKASLILRVTPGYAFPSAGFSADAAHVRLLRGINVGVGHLRWDDTVYWDDASDTSLAPYVLRAGDVVLGMDRPWVAAGMRIARVREEDLPALLLQRVALLRPSPALDNHFMFWAYRSSSFRAAVESEMTGLSVPHLSGEQIGSHRIPRVSLSLQNMIATQLDKLERITVTAISEMNAQVSALDARLRSLTTAAVTGEFDVTAASGRVI